jgi:hypothetical protein
MYDAAPAPRACPHDTLPEDMAQYSRLPCHHLDDCPNTAAFLAHHYTPYVS